MTDEVQSRPSGQTLSSIFPLSDSDRDKYGVALEHVPSPYVDFEQARVESIRALSHLPADLIRIAERFRLGETTPFLIIRNLPRDAELPPTPLGCPPSDKNTFIAEGCLLGITSVLGTQYGYSAERNGDRLHHTTPLPGKEDSPSSSGSRCLLEAHTEVTALRPLELNPEYIAITILRSNPAAATLYASAQAIWERLDVAEQRIGRDFQFHTRIPESFTAALGGDYGMRAFTAPHPLFAGPDDDPEIIFDAGATEAGTDEGQRLIERIKAELTDETLFRPFVGEPGDLMLLDNRRGIHGRTAFKPVFDGLQRWPIRVYLMSPANIFRNRHLFDAQRGIFRNGV